MSLTKIYTTEELSQFKLLILKKMAHLRLMNGYLIQKKILSLFRNNLEIKD